GPADAAPRGLSHLAWRRAQRFGAPVRVPYTTLVRSDARPGPCEASEEEVGQPCARLPGVQHHHLASAVRRIDAVHVGPQRDPARSKSTRLNSSHVKISYAVLCLIKRTKMRTTLSTIR